MSEFNRRKQSFSIPNLPLYLIIAYVIGYVIQLTTPELYQFLQFNPYEIFQGQIWRVVTWILVPPESLGIFTIIMLFLYYSLGRELEHTWGSERFTKYIFSGIIFTVIAGLILYVVLTVIYGTAMGSIFGVIIGGYVSTAAGLDFKGFLSLPVQFFHHRLVFMYRMLSELMAFQAQIYF